MAFLVQMWQNNRKNMNHTATSEKEDKQFNLKLMLNYWNEMMADGVWTKTPTLWWNEVLVRGNKCQAYPLICLLTSRRRRCEITVKRMYTKKPSWNHNVKIPKPSNRWWMMAISDQIIFDVIVTSLANINDREALWHWRSSGQANIQNILNKSTKLTRGTFAILIGKTLQHFFLREC